MKRLRTLPNKKFDSARTFSFRNNLGKCFDDREEINLFTRGDTWNGLLRQKLNEVDALVGRDERGGGGGTLKD